MMCAAHGDPVRKQMADYVRPRASLYETDDLEWAPASITGHTTTLLDKKESKP